MKDDTQGQIADCLILPPGVRTQIEDHLRNSLPNEGVGLLAVEWVNTEEQRIAVTRHFYPGANFLASPTRFEMDRHQLITALRDIDQHDWSLGAIVHSHPRGPATPSPTDLAEANYPESLMMIASFATNSPDLRAWRLDPGSAGWEPRQVPILENTEDAIADKNCS